ncbi:MFS transporter [Burkholderia gladioli]|jgi:MFS family permease|uniref:Major Facilitator Superfamily protein n=1 Tax=Burkholderia gladioli TaxID=28095 RepID=A0AAW7R558_BURGA|nr:MFS transporter [Burkholderia gladioli]AJW96748.1 major Facilitator Superfamily protein [Burkholderia gladioli]ASD82436.1 MFS transporter [Burkholderia gladioli pv. gladioli]ATF87331.1 MFS transporter [Burkholderia gladioli pv. gladioli]AWY52685.1 MFS transporter [Burkholderia gladioli pv. gladioli]KGC15095.1 major Facilitator Superfamily protein [Burkholderia gladioli]
MASSSAIASDGREAGSETGIAVIRKVAWRLMPLIMICYLFAFFDRINISFAKFQLQGDLGLSDTAYGLGASLFVIGYVLFEVPSNMLLYRVGARRWIARIMISWGIATAAMVFVHTEWQFYGLRFVIGAMEAGFAPGVLYYLTLWFPPSHRGRITSLLFLASAFSGLVGAPAAGLVLGHLNGALGMPGWHWLFLLGGVPCVLLGVLVMVQLKDRIEDASWLSGNEKAWLAGQIAQQSRHPQGGHSLLGALRTPGFLMLGLVYFLIQIASYGLNFWAPHLIRTAGTQNPTLIGLLTSVPYIAGAIAMVTVGRLSDASGERRKYVVALLLMASVGFFAAGYFDRQTTLLLVALAVIGAGVVASIPAFWALPPKLVTGAGAAGGIAVINTLGQLGGIVSPVMVGRVRDLTGSTTPALYVIALLSLVCALLVAYALPASLRERDARLER